jgi:hypothetical protein
VFLTWSFRSLAANEIGSLWAELEGIFFVERRVEFESIGGSPSDFRTGFLEHLQRAPDGDARDLRVASVHLRKAERLGF